MQYLKVCPGFVKVADGRGLTRCFSVSGFALPLILVKGMVVRGYNLVIVGSTQISRNFNPSPGTYYRDVHGDSLAGVELYKIASMYSKHS